MREQLHLHDAIFEGAIVSGRDCDLLFRTTSGEARKVKLIGVDALRMDDFRQGNIVVLFETTTAVTPLHDAWLERLYGAPHPSVAKEFRVKHEAYLAKKLAAVESAELILVEMQPAIGAVLFATCKQVVEEAL